MAGSLNRVTLIGRLGNDPEVRNFANGGQVVSFSLATSESWKDRNSGERQERTEWHRISIFTDGLGDMVAKHARKGGLVYIEGKLENRKWTDQQGVERYSTEVALRPFNGEFKFLGDPPAAGGREGRGEHAQGGSRGRGQRAPAGAGVAGRDMDDDIPF